MNAALILLAAGGYGLASGNLSAHKRVIARSPEEEQMLMNPARPVQDMQRTYKINAHHPPRPIKDVFLTHRFQAGDFVAGAPFHSHGWNYAYPVRDPVTGATFYRYGHPAGGEGEILG